VALRALVLGASGHIGNAIARELTQHGHAVTAVSRKKDRARNLLGLPVDYVVGDADSPEQLSSLIEGHDLVVDAAAPYPMPFFGATQDNDPNSLAYAVRRTETLLDAVRKRDARLVFVSSFTTVPRTPSSGSSPWQASLARLLHPYFEVKEKMESLVLDAAKRGLRAVIVNPTMCLGPWECRARAMCLIPQLLGGEIPMAPRHVLNVIDVRDAAAGIVAALEAERYGQPTLLCGRNVSIESLFSWICEIGGVAPPRFYVPPAVSIVALYSADLALALFGQPMSNASLALALASTHDWMTADPSQRDLGVRLRPLSETLQDSVQWHRQIGYC
jgi:dihydroflavonol-4-reductase